MGRAGPRDHAARVRVNPARERPGEGLRGPRTPRRGQLGAARGCADEKSAARRCDRDHSGLRGGGQAL